MDDIGKCPKCGASRGIIFGASGDLIACDECSRKSADAERELQKDRLDKRSKVADTAIKSVAAFTGIAALWYSRKSATKAERAISDSGPPPRARRVIIDGIAYRTLDCAAEDLGLGRLFLKRLISRGVLPAPPVVKYGRGSIWVFPDEYMARAREILQENKIRVLDEYMTRGQIILERKEISEQMRLAIGNFWPHDAGRAVALKAYTFLLAHISATPAPDEVAPAAFLPLFFDIRAATEWMVETVPTFVPAEINVTIMAGLVPALFRALGAWLHDPSGRTVRLKIGDIELEAQTREKLEKLLSGKT